MSADPPDVLSLPALPVEPATFALREYVLWQSMRTEAFGQVWRPVIPDVREVLTRQPAADVADLLWRLDKWLERMAQEVRRQQRSHGILRRMWAPRL